MNEIEEVLKNLSGNELAQVQNAVLTDPGLDPTERMAGLMLVTQEINLRQNEGFGRKAERFLNRHGEQLAIVAIGALFGVGIDRTLRS